MSALIWCPFPDADHAKATASTLLDEKLIVCANILGPMDTLYPWDGKICHNEDKGVLFKAKEDLLDTCVEHLGELHDYDSPAILGWSCDVAYPSTQVWLKSMGA